MNTTHAALIADRSPIYRLGLKSVISDHLRIPSIHEASDGLSALRLAREFRPALVILEVELRTLNAYEIGRCMAQLGVTTRIVFVGEESQLILYREAAELGVRAYLHRATSLPDLIRTLTWVHEGRNCLSPPSARRPVEPEIDKSCQPAQR
jgi:DNA-binding NarL/FixJ family response regulator